ncbi:MAG TPA: efflux transporter outer membrane subunit [Gammaproteobacteria bacterium]
MTSVRRRIAAAAALALAGCELAPPHVRPDLPTAAGFPAEYVDDPLDGVRAPEVDFRTFIDDARLEALIAAALERNRDLTIAVARIEEARGTFRVQRSERVPTLGASADSTRSRIVAGGAVGGFPSGSGGTIESRAVGLGVSAFELDFWGRVRDLTDAALAEYLASTAAARAVALSLIGEVADAYLALLEADARIGLAEATVASRREELEIAERRLDAGAVSALEVAQVETLLTQAETELAALKLQRAQASNALTVLVGGPLDAELPEPAPLGEQASDVPLAAGLPSELLAARPDVIAAEQRLIAARANIGAARAAFFPSISLTGTSGYSSSELDGLFSQDGRTWTFGPSLTLPLFDLGRRRANVTIAEAREDVAVADYERTIQTAFREVADALAGRRYLAEQVDAQRRATEAQRELAELARRRYDAGVVSYLEVLDAERNLFDAEQALLQVRRAEAANLIALYVALGGGVTAE